MLAERKKKMKWTLNPRGNCWSKDTNKFGQRMLEKMGWKSGDGLGVNKQGITEHIKIAYKNDNKCLGYKDNGEHWVEHQSQFESLLAELSSSHSSVAAALDSEKDKIPQTTLEQRSRHSRTRVHYQKFTRGKDLSRYSEKDLKCILLGKQTVNNADEENEDYDENNDYLNGFYGIKTINSGTMNDYFKKLTNSQNHSDSYSSDVQFGEEELSEENRDGEQGDVKVKKKKKRKAEVLLSDTERNDMDSNEASSIKQHEKKRKKLKIPEHTDNANDEQPFTEYENESVSKKKLNRHDITNEDTCINDMCDEICRKKKSKKQKSGSIQDRECEVMEVDDELEDVQVKKKSKKRHSDSLSEDKETLLEPAEGVSSETADPKDAVELLTIEVDDEVEDRQTKKNFRKKNPVLPSKGQTSVVPVECVSHESKNKEDADLHLKAKVEGNQKKKKLKKKKQEFTSKGGETSVLPAEDVSHKFENSKDTEDHLSVEVEDEIEGKQLKKKSRKKKYELLNEGGETSFMPVEDIPQVLQNSENTVEHIVCKDEEKLMKGTHGVHISLKNNLTNAEINRLDHHASSDNESRSNEQSADVLPTRRKKNKNIIKDEVENSVAEDFSKHVNDISVEKKKHKRKEAENEIDEQSKHAELVMKEEDKEINPDKELHSVVNSISGSFQTIVNENLAEKLYKGHLGSFVESNERYSIDDIKNMKSSLFAQLVDPRLVEFKGSNLHAIAGYGKW